MKEYKTLDLGAVITKVFEYNPSEDDFKKIVNYTNNGIELSPDKNYIIRSLVIPKKSNDIIEKIYINPFMAHDGILEVISKNIEKCDGYTCVDISIHPNKKFIIYNNTDMIRYKLKYLVKDMEDIRYES